MALALTEQLIHTTVRIGSKDAAGNTSSGTGFWFSFQKQPDDSHVPALVTNKHVIESAIESTIHLTLRDKSTGGPLYGSHFPITLTGGEAMWMMHPDPSIDLAICPLGVLLSDMEEQGVLVHRVSFDFDIVASEELGSSLLPMEDIVMIGYPIGIWDHANNVPIIRRGITATPYRLNYQGRAEFMIDAACFPGSSGSPVCLLNQGSYATRGGDLAIGNRLALLGILYAGPQHTAAGEIIVQDIPTAARPIPISRIPSNLGNCIKASALQAFEGVLSAS